MCNIPRLRTIEESHKWLAEEDPDSGISKGMLRNLVGCGEIPSVQHGRVRLINIDTLSEEIAKWVERKALESVAQKQEQELHQKPIAAIERRETGGKYGQVKAI